VAEAAAYHDNKWGEWRDVTWEWGAARGRRLSLLYGGLYSPERTLTSPFLLALVDSLGMRQALRFDTIAYRGSRPANGLAGVSAPEHFRLLASRGADTVRVEVEVEDALASEMAAVTFQRAFLQMRGSFTLMGKLSGETVADTGQGFFETYVSR
jgi:hypothetical protein